MHELRAEEENDRVRLVIFLEGPLIQNLDLKLADLKVTHSTLMAAAIGWYSTRLADQYRILTMDDLPQLSERPEMTNWPSQGMSAHFLLQPIDYENLEQHMADEGLLDPGETGKKFFNAIFMELAPRH